MTLSPRHFSRSTKRQAYARSGGCCERCWAKFPAGGGGTNYDHIIPWEHSRDSSLGNCAVLCAECHLKKTARYDIPVIAKVQRIADRAIGIRKPSKKMRGHRDDTITITMNRGVQPRLKGKGAKHQKTMAALWPFGRPE